MPVIAPITINMIHHFVSIGVFAKGNGNQTMDIMIFSLCFISKGDHLVSFAVIKWPHNMLRSAYGHTITTTMFAPKALNPSHVAYKISVLIVMDRSPDFIFSHCVPPGMLG